MKEAEQQLSNLGGKTPQYDFYVASNDREIMRHLDALMRQKGYLGIADSGGRMHYVLDARQDLYRQVHKVLQISEKHKEQTGEPQPNLEALDDEIEALLDDYPFNKALRGYQILRYLLHHSVLDDSKLYPVSKQLYPLAEKRYQMTTLQVERSLRYVFREAGFEGGSASVIRRLHHLLMERLIQAA